MNNVEVMQEMRELKLRVNKLERINKKIIDEIVGLNLAVDLVADILDMDSDNSELI